MIRFAGNMSREARRGGTRSLSPVTISATSKRSRKASISIDVAMLTSVIFSSCRLQYGPTMCASDWFGEIVSLVEREVREGFQRFEVGGLPALLRPKLARLIRVLGGAGPADSGREVTDKDKVLSGQQKAMDHFLEIQPVVPAPAATSQSEIQVEAIHIGNNPPGLWVAHRNLASSDLTDLPTNVILLEAPPEIASPGRRPAKGVSLALRRDRHRPRGRAGGFRTGHSRRLLHHDIKTHRPRGCPRHDCQSLKKPGRRLRRCEHWTESAIVAIILIGR
jgi:hypothetical protein